MSPQLPQRAPLTSTGGKIKTILLSANIGGEHSEEEIFEEFREVINSFPPDILFFVQTNPRFTPAFKQFDRQAKSVLNQPSASGFLWTKGLAQKQVKDLKNLEKSIQKVAVKTQNQTRKLREKIEENECGSRVTFLDYNINIPKLVEEYLYYLYSGQTRPGTQSRPANPTEFPQDPFHVISWEGKYSSILRPVFIGRNRGSEDFWDRMLGDMVSSQTHVPLTPSTLIFEGSDILFSSGERAIVSARWLGMNLEDNPGKSVAEICERFRRDLGVCKIGWPGYFGEDPAGIDFDSLGHPRHFHLDMYLALGGMAGDKHQFFLGSDFQTYGSANQRVFEQSRVWIKKVKDWILRSDDSYGIPPADKIELIELPHLSDGNTEYTFCNVLFEERDGKRVVYLPNYASSKYMGRSLKQKLSDQFDIASQRYSDAGFEVREVKGLYRYIGSGGSLHCIAKVLEREP